MSVLLAITGREWRDANLLLNGCHISLCVFDHCRLELWVADPHHKLKARRLGANVSLCTFNNGCEYVGDGWPKRGEPGWLAGMP